MFFTLRCLGYAEKKITDKAIEIFIKSFRGLLAGKAIGKPIITEQTILVFRNFGQKLIKQEGFRSNWSLS